MTAVQRLEMLLMGFLLGSREQVKINAFGNEGRPNQSTAGNVLLGKIFCPKRPQNVAPLQIVIGSSLRVRTIFPSEIHFRCITVSVITAKVLRVSQKYASDQVQTTYEKIPM